MLLLKSILMCMKIQSFNMQVHVSKIILNSSNLVLSFKIVVSLVGSHKDEGSNIEIKIYFLVFLDYESRNI